MTKKLPTVSEALKALAGKNTLVRLHPLDHYVEALKYFPYEAVAPMDAGTDSLVVELADGRVFKVSCKTLTDRMGNRPYDCPVLERGKCTYKDKNVFWHIQPHCGRIPPWREDDVYKVVGDLVRMGYNIRDWHPRNFGLIGGKIVLVDLYSNAEPCHQSDEEWIRQLLHALHSPEIGGAEKHEPMDERLFNFNRPPH